MTDIEKYGNFDGIEMGVDLNGVPFLTASGLAVMCGVTPGAITRWGEFVADPSTKGGAGIIANLLQDHDFTEPTLFTKKLNSDNTIINAYPEKVCMAILEYYAYEAGSNCTDKAKKFWRVLATKTFRDFVYTLVGYKQQKQLTFNEYTLSRITYHHTTTYNPLPDGYFCLFDKMIEVLQKFDLRIGYQLGEQWFDTRKNDFRFLEPDISLGNHFSQFFESNFDETNKIYIEEYNKRLNRCKKGNFWTKKLKALAWEVHKCEKERDIRVKYLKIEGVDSSLPIPSKYIDRCYYGFRPSPDSNRPEYLSAYCYSNDYMSMFFEWLRDVFFKFVWKDYILERDPNGWMKRYNKFLSKSEKEQVGILTTLEGKLIEGYRYHDLWKKELPGYSDE